MHHRISRRQRPGATTVEFALTAPILFMFIIVGIEFGRANMIRGTLGNAAYEGAREAITPGATADEAKMAAHLLLDATFVRGAKIDVQPPNITEETPEVTVSIEASFDQNSWITGLFTNGLKLKNSRTLQREKDDPSVQAGFSPGATTGGAPPPGGAPSGGFPGGWGGSGPGSGSWGGGWGGWGGGGGGGGRGGRGGGGRGWWGS